MQRTFAALVLLAALAAGGCATGPETPYPAFIQADELPDVFLAALPGVRAKQFAGNPQTRRSSNRIVLPAAWSGTTGASPGKSLEIYVVYGEIQVGDLTLRPGGYGWFPPGFSGANLSSRFGAEILYFLDDANPANAIDIPILYSTEVTDWQPLSPRPADRGISIKPVRHDPGSGARTWLLRVEPQARIPWQSRGRSLEGYLLSGRYRASECVGGKVETGEYTEGGYFLRPPNTVHGGPAERAIETSIWLLRLKGDAPAVITDRCSAPAQ